MIKTNDDLQYYMEQDRIMNKFPKYGIKTFVRDIFDANSIYNFLRTLRKAEYYYNKKRFSLLQYYYRYRLKIISKNLGFDIPLNTCGPGLSLPHYGSIIINGACQIGKNCRIHSCVNIGASGGSTKVPQLGDNVYIGPSAVIFGDITIASNITIGANSTVNKSFVDEHVAIAGTPAKIIKRDMQNWLVFNKLYPSIS